MSHLSCSVRPPAFARSNICRVESAARPRVLSVRVRKSNPDHICNFYQNIWQCKARTRIRLSTSLTVKKAQSIIFKSVQEVQKGTGKSLTPSAIISRWVWISTTLVCSFLLSSGFLFFSVEHAKSSLGGGYLTVWYKRRSDGRIQNWRKPSFGVCTVWVQKQLNILAQRSRIDTKMLDMYVQ